MPNICLMALIGLPAAGKTTLSKCLLQSSLPLNIIHICYDDIIAFKLNAEKQFHSIEFKYKEQRHYVLNKILIKLITIIKMHGHINEINLPISVHYHTSNNYLIVCDDNHYYRSMRYELYQLARAHNLSYIQLYLECNITIALERNLKRSIKDKVPEIIIYKMFEKFQKPSVSSAVPWEKNTIIINVAEQLQKNANIHLQIFPCIIDALKTPLKQSSADKIISCNQEQSITHKLDLLLRKRITEIMESDLKLINKDEKYDKAEYLKKRRKQILYEFKKAITFTNHSNDLLDFVQLLN